MWVLGTASTTGSWWNTIGEILESTKVPVPWHCETVIGGGELADCEDCVKPIGAN